MTSMQRLDAVCEITMGQAPDGESYNTDDDGLPLIAGAGDFGEKHPVPKKFTNAPGKVCALGDIVLGIRASIGEKVIADRDYCLGRGVAGLRPKSGLHSRYLWHWLTQAAPVLTAKARGATFKQVNRDDIGVLRIDVPPLPEQQRIAEILDKADALRAKRRAALAQLDTLTQSIFLDMFGDPVLNPRRWPQDTLETLFHFTTGKLDSNAAVVSGQYPFFTCSREDFRIDTFAFDCEALLLAGNNAIADYSVKHYKGKFNAYQRTYVITLRDERNSYEYSRFVLEHRLAELKRISKGTGTKYLTLELLNRIRVPVPPQELQGEFARRVGALENPRMAQRVALAELEGLFTSLQHRAFRGEL
jgi:type I restriction enzyme S subunit